MKPHSQLHLFWVGDNSAGLNWGRGASIALRQMLETQFSVVGRVIGNMFDARTAPAVYIGTLLPTRYIRYYRRALKYADRWPISWYIALEKAFGATDVVSENPAVTVDRLLRNRHRHSEFQAICSHAEAADLIVIDGDGDIVFTSPPRRQTLFLLAMIELGIRLGKPVFLVNSMISDCPETGRNLSTMQTASRLFSQCRAVALRDPESMEYVRTDMPGVCASLIPDSLFTWFPIYRQENSRPPLNGDFIFPYPEETELWGKLDFSLPYICIGGGALAASHPDEATERYVHLTRALLALGFPVYLTENDTPDSFLRRVAAETGVGLIPAKAPILACGSVLAHAALFISGRYHPSILASLGGTPCICLESHAHKMASFSTIMEYDSPQIFSGLPGDQEIDAIVATARSLIADGELLRQRIRAIAQKRCREASSLPGFLQQNMLSPELALQTKG